jgi:hypothetical protein
LCCLLCGKLEPNGFADSLDNRESAAFLLTRLSYPTLYLFD